MKPSYRTALKSLSWSYGWPFATIADQLDRKDYLEQDSDIYQAAYSLCQNKGATDPVFRTWAEHFKEVHIALGTYKGIVGMWKEVITSLRNLAANDKTKKLDLVGMEKTIRTAQENINKHRCEFGEKLDALWSREMP